MIKWVDVWVLKRSRDLSSSGKSSYNRDIESKLRRTHSTLKVRRCFIAKIVDVIRLASE